jgi:hypothetical protein
VINRDIKDRLADAEGIVERQRDLVCEIAAADVARGTSSALSNFRARGRAIELAAAAGWEVLLWRAAPAPH